MLCSQRDRAQLDYYEAKSIYDKGRSVQAQFPAEAERSKARYAKAKSALEDLDAKLKEVEADISSTETDVAARMEAVARSGIEERFSKVEKQMEKHSDENKKLMQDNLDLHKAVRQCTMDARSSAGIASKSLTRITDLEAAVQVDKNHHVNEISSLKEQISKIQSDARLIAAANTSLVSNTNNFALLSESVNDIKHGLSEHHGHLSQLEEQLNRLSETVLQRSSVEQNSLLQVKSLEAGLATATTSYAELLSKVEVLQNQQANLSTIQDGFENLEFDVSTFGVDLASHQLRIKALERTSDAAHLSGDSAPTHSFAPVVVGTEENVSGSPVEQSQWIQKLDEEVRSLKADSAVLKTANAGLTASHEQGDKIYGTLIDSLKTGLENLSDVVIEMKADIKTHQNSVGDDMARVSLRLDEQGQLPKIVDGIKAEIIDLRASQTKPDHGLQNKLATSPQISLQKELSKTDMGAYVAQHIIKGLTSSQDALQQSMKELKIAQDGTDQGLRNLDSRMNNINTEHLARQIIGQLQYAYPNLHMAEALFLECKENLASLETKLGAHGQSIRSAEEDAHKQNAQAQLDKENLLLQIGRVHSEVKSKLEANVKQQELDTSSHTETLKSELTELVHTSTKTLQDEIDSINGIIMFDDGTNIETAKERINILLEKYGLLFGHVDDLERQVKEINGARFAAASDSRSVMGASKSSSAAVSRAGAAGLQGTKRNASLGLRTVNGRTTKKRKNNNFGAFVSSDDDDEDGASE